MVDSVATKHESQSGLKQTAGHLLFLELSGGRIHAVRPDGSDHRILVTDCRLPDGIAIDVKGGHIYWTNMGVPSQNDGSIERVDFEGKNRTTIVAQGVTHTPKQLHLDLPRRKIYWCDREGMRVMRSSLDGSQVETLVITGSGDIDAKDQTRWCVGITIDYEKGFLYWTQKGPDNAGKGRILRAPIEIPRGESASNRTDVEVWLDGLPEPIDLELDAENRVLYWTDRGDPPTGNTVNRLHIDASQGQRRPEAVLTHLMEGIGIALDISGDRLFVTDLGGTVYAATLDGSQTGTLLFAQGNLSGIAYIDQEIKS